EEDQEEEPKDDDDDMEMDDEAEDEETPPTSPIIPDADGQPIRPIASFSQNFHFGESSSTTNLLSGNSNIVPTGRAKKKFKEQDRYFVGLGCDNIEKDRTMRNVISDLSRLEKNGKEFYREFGEYMCRMLQNRQKSECSFPLPLGSDVAIAAAVATSSIDDDDDDTTSMDSQTYEPRGSPRNT
nr:hypothetical protein [Tanacetum cinerariifolium]